MLWLFLIFVVLLSGVVAYAADTIARRAGRKHIRWFGLRPKTTALLVAVLSGMAISAASLTAFLLLNKNAVDTIAAADQLRPQLEALRREIGVVQEDLRIANQGRDAARREAERLGALQAAAQRDLASTREDLKTARATETRLNRQAQELKTQARALAATIASLEGRARENRAKLQASEAALKASQQRSQDLDAQVLDFRARTALAQQEARTAQDRADLAQQRAQQAEVNARAVQVRAEQAQATARQTLTRARQQATAAQQQASGLREQVTALEASRTGARLALEEARLALAAAQQARSAAEQQRLAAQQARDALAAERDRVARQRDQLTSDRNRLAGERDTLSRQRDQAQGDLLTLQQQQLKLKNSNDALSRELATARATLGKLQDEYSTSRAELSASLNTDLAYPKNDLVYAAVVPSVRNLDRFLQDAGQAAQARGARGTPPVRLSGGARGALETKLRGLNVSTFVQCRAAQNAALGFPVDLSCDARPNSVLYREGEIIRRVSVNLRAEPTVIQNQISDLVKDTIVDITNRGVPDEYILNQGLDVSEFLTLLGRLSSRSGSDATAVVGVAARGDVKPSTRVDLYPVLP